jgi:2,4-dienoyl-CoA reductase-like NADH-dependent reductase (Old Yellow Enzyme family)
MGGGSVENRCRFHCEVFKNVRKKVSADFPVIVKLGVQDAIAGGLKLKDGIVAAEIIAKAGDINAIEVSQGLSPGLLDFSNSSMRIGITSIEKEGYYRAWAREVKNAVKSTGILVIMQGCLRSFELMEEVVQKKEADLVSMCRPYIREPMLINRWISGDHKKISFGGARLGLLLYPEPTMTHIPFSLS